MVSNIDIYPLLRMIWNLATIQHSCVLKSGLTITAFRVKGDGGLMDYLGACYDISKRSSEKFSELSNLNYEIGNWMTVFDQEYANSNSLTRKSVDLTRNHAKKLSVDIDKWWTQIYTIFDKQNTQTINEKELRVMVKDLLGKLDANEKKDLMDGYECIICNIPTPAAMILYRIAESMVRKYYIFEIGRDPSEGTTLGGMANEIRIKQAKEIEEKKRSKPDSVLNYVLSQAEDRNLAQHPERRFDQTEAEEVFIFVKKLINDIHEKIGKLR